MRQRNIAIDARWAVRRTNGIGQYILQLALRLPLLAPDIRFTLLVDRALDRRGLPHGCSQAVLGTYLGDGTPASRCYSPFWLNYEVPRYLRQHRIDLFHGANFVIPRFASCPAVTTVHDMAVFRIPYAFGPVYRRYMRWQISSAVRRADAVVTVSESTRNDIVELLDVPAVTIQVAHNGVDGCYREHHPDGYLRDVRSTLGLPKTFILHVGIVEKRKNLSTVLKAGAAVLGAGMADGIVFAGRDGLGAVDIRRLASSLGLGAKARFLGFVPQELMPGLYALAKVVVFPSLYEGFGLPVLEAMASGVPVIASRTSAIPEVAGDAAILLEQPEPAALQSALVDLLTNSALSADLRSRGLSQAKKFTWEAAAAKHVEVYRRVLEED